MLRFLMFWFSVWQWHTTQDILQLALCNQEGVGASRTVQNLYFGTQGTCIAGREALFISGAGFPSGTVPYRGLFPFDYYTMYNHHGSFPVGLRRLWLEWLFL